MAAQKLGKLVVKNSCLFLCDMQEKFRPTIQYFPQIVNVSARMLQAARILDMPVVVTEQYPKGLGHVVPELGVKDEKVFPKTCFSMVLPEVEEYMKQRSDGMDTFDSQQQSGVDREQDVKSVVLCGIETQACILQTALDLIEKGYDVHVIADACSSRSMVDRWIFTNFGPKVWTAEESLRYKFGTERAKVKVTKAPKEHFWRKIFTKYGPKVWTVEESLMHKFRTGRAKIKITRDKKVAKIGTFGGRMYALERMRKAGAYLTTSESMMLLLCRDAAHPKFRDIQKIIWEPAPDSGLLTGMPQDGSAL